MNISKENNNKYSKVSIPHITIKVIPKPKGLWL